MQDNPDALLDDLEKPGTDDEPTPIKLRYKHISIPTPPTHVTVHVQYKLWCLLH